MKNHIWRLKDIAIAAAVMIFSGCSSLPQFMSERCAAKIRMDGDLNEWKGIPAYIDKNNVFAVSVCHDNENVYVCLTTDDPQTERQIMGGGLTVWLDPSGSDDKVFGINYPLPRNAAGPRRNIDIDMRRDYNGIQEAVDQSLMDMDVVRPKVNDRYRLSIVNNEGIAVHINRSSNGMLVYELQVPLKKTNEHPNAIEPKKDFVGLGFETGAIQFGGGRPRGEGGASGGNGGSEGSPSSGGGRYGHRGGGGGRGRSGNSSNFPKQPDPIDMWWKVKL